MSSFIGIDASLRGTALALVRNSTLITTKLLDDEGTKLTGAQRLSALRSGVLNFIAHHQEAEHILIEGYSFGSNSRAHSIGEWGGVLKLALYDAYKKVHTLDPNNLKKFGTGKGNTAGKAAMIMALYKRTGIDLSHSDDECDAAWLAFAIEAKVLNLDVTKPQTEALKKVQTLPSQRIRTRGR